MTEPQIIIADWQTDNAILKQLRRIVFIEEQSVPEELEWDEQDATAIHFLAKIENTAVATARLTSTGQIGRMAVLEKYRRQGIGSALLRKVLETAARKNIEHMFLHAQVQVVDFYKKSGFVERGELFMDAGILHREMQR
ncbi:MAG: GNAT family N-acetyltransferase [Gammaproteobacteria bacterium]